MEQNNPGTNEGRLPIQTQQDSSGTENALDIIRTETVLSKLPVHNLAKKGRVDIRILRTTADGEIELKWEVSYNERYGQARQLAYKLDTIIINQRIDEAPRPLPEIIRLGSLNDMQRELGSEKNELKHALQQNATTAINAKLVYKGNDGTERRLEALFTRYSVIFTGEKLPDGRKADAVYIILNKPYREVLDNAPVRPLDRTYMKELPPAAQRFYEIISYKIFSALKNKHPFAKLTYSEYCTYSAQHRSLDWNFVRPQMYQVHKPHIDSGYIAKPIRHETIADKEGNLDWIFLYTPGPKAEAEFAIAYGRKPKVAPTLTSEPVHRTRRSHAAQLPATSSQPIHTFDPQLVAEFTRRGITEKKAIEILSNLKPGQDVIAQLEYGEQMAKNSKFPILNPPGFYIRLIESNTTIPDGFETSAKRKAREEREARERQQRSTEEARRELEWEYGEYCRIEVERYIEQNPEAFEAMKQAKWQQYRAEHPAFSDDMITTIAIGEATREFRKKLPLPTLDEFAAQKEDGTIPSLIPAVSPPASEIDLDGATPAPVDGGEDLLGYETAAPVSP